MATQTTTAPLPYGVGRVGIRFSMLVVGLLAVVAWGIGAYVLQLTEGEVVTGTRNIGTMGGAT